MTSQSDIFGSYRGCVVFWRPFTNFSIYGLTNTTWPTAPGEFLAPPTYICAVSHQFKTKLRAKFELYREASEDAKLINGGDVKPVKGRMYYHVFSRVLCILVRTGKRITIRCSLILLKFTPIWCNQSKNIQAFHVLLQYHVHLVTS